MSADIGNPEGYFELWSIVRANDELLAHFGGRWDSPPDFRPHWTDDPVAIEFVATMRTAVEQLFEGNSYLLKDPRVSLLLPLWRQVTSDNGCAVVIVREPLEVASSLFKRDDLPMLTGLALWAAYNRSMLRDLRGARVHVCNYADLIENPVAVLGDIADSLRAWGEVSEDLDLEKAFNSIRPERRRNSISEGGMNAESSPVEINELMKLTLDQRGRHDVFDMGTALEPGWWENALLEERRRLLTWGLGALAELQIHNDALVTENAILWQRNEEVTRELDRLQDRVDRLRRLVPGPLYRAVAKLTRRT
jgi:hypothetical protein